MLEDARTAGKTVLHACAETGTAKQKKESMLWLIATTQSATLFLLDLVQSQ